MTLLRKFLERLSLMLMRWRLDLKQADKIKNKYVKEKGSLGVTVRLLRVRSPETNTQLEDYVG